MSTPKKSIKSAGVKPDVIERFIPLFAKNVQRIAEVQKKSLEIAAEQNAEFVETCKKAFDFAPETPGLFFFDLFGQACERAIETEKGMIEFAVEQSKAVSEIAKERAGSLAKVAESVSGLVQESIEQSVKAQKKAIEFCAEQGKTAYETGKKLRISNPFAEAIQVGFDELAETEKVVLDVAAKPFGKSAAA